VLLLTLAPFPDVLFYELFLAVFIVAGFARYGLERIGLYRWWQGYVQIAADFALLAFILVVPNPLATVHPPVQMTLRFGNFRLFLRPPRRPCLQLPAKAGDLGWHRRIDRLGHCGGLGFHAAGYDPDAPMDLTVNSVMLRASIPSFVDLDMPIRDIVVFLIVSALLAAVVVALATW